MMLYEILPILGMYIFLTSSPELGEEIITRDGDVHFLRSAVRSDLGIFITDGLKEVFDDISPIEDFNQSLSLEFVDFQIARDDIKYTIEECKERDATYAAPLKVKVRLASVSFCLAVSLSDSLLWYSSSIFKTPRIK